MIRNRDPEARRAGWLERLQKHRVAKHHPLRLEALALLLSRLQDVNESGDGWSACCPSHPDSRPSLSIDIARDGMFLVNCHAGCEFDEIVWGAGMMVGDMFESTPSTGRAVLRPRQSRPPVPELTPADPKWAGNQKNYLLRKHRPKVVQLAEDLGVSHSALEALSVGWCSSESCWTFPEKNGAQEICGIIRRFSDGRKLAFKGSKRGLSLPKGWDKSDEPLHICEGASDVAAALTMNLRAIGRPALAGGFKDLAILLREEPSDIIVIADNDAKGTGIAGANRVADKLREVLKKSKSIGAKAPSSEFKDLRTYLINQ